MTLSLICAMAENRVIGRDGRLPWHLPADLRHFKATTLDHTLIVGRKTFESLGGPLPRRRFVVLSRDRAYRPEGAELARSLDDALALTEGEEEVFVGGGEDVFRLALPRADRLYLTVVHAEVEGDTRFPELDLDAWRLVSDERHEADERHAWPLSFRLYERPEAAEAR